MSRGENYIHDEEAYARATQARIRANARAGKRQRWIAEDASREALAERVRLDGYDKPGSFLGKMATSLEEWGSLSPGQEAAVRKIYAERDSKIAARKAADANSQHVGTIGERREFTAIIQFKTSFPGSFGDVHIGGLRDAAGNVLIVKGSNPVRGERGETITFKATIKKHETREGVAQTVLNRPKFQDVPTEHAAHGQAFPAVDPAPKAAAPLMDGSQRYDAQGQRIWLVMCDRANGTVDSYPQQFTSQSEAQQAMDDIRAMSPKYLLGWYTDGRDVLYIDRQY